MLSMDMKDENSLDGAESLKKKLSAALLWRLSKNEVHIATPWKAGQHPEVVLVQCLPTPQKKLKKRSFCIMLAVRRIGCEAGTMSAVCIMNLDHPANKRNAFDEIYVDASDDIELKAQMRGKAWIPLLGAKCLACTIEKLMHEIESKAFNSKDKALAVENTCIAGANDSFEKIFIEMDLTNDIRDH